ncbi:sensor histidine kinase [Qipengyuania sp. 1XM1-15A]|uniref:histidine kinase dimerization/phospho-acceptor domain-containing protein n=1 Tax=Qipengyuania xiamenensis TaxID=2867237 RepID=UPI001C879054|nr:histidine kinase dimerization/phospho-acceptor domain-containing protein [Qipengyuania xiamenensis]MBX7532087.1 sensor histidine kinase [Qipengyuania xiamenensis]
MHFDDRLATVLRIRAASERAAKTQFRQLIDLLGERPQAGDKALKAASYLRLIALGEMISVVDRAKMVGESGWRFRNPELVKWFGEAHPQIAAAALYRAQLTAAEWEEIIPKLPIRARGFLRHRKDLPVEAERILDRLGVSDRALPEPEPFELIDEIAPPEPEAETPEPDAEPAVEAEPAEPAPRTAPGKDDVRALVDRIETFRKARSGETSRTEAPRLPLGEAVDEEAKEPLGHFLFAADSEGRVNWAEERIASMVVGIDLAALGSDTIAAAIQRRQPLDASRVTLRGATRIEGDWIVDAAPRFTRGEGRFFGYVGRFRRAVSDEADRREAEADRLRQLLHELRTPVNAMQGYAEIIQQQMIGPVPHEYRSLAATIAGDSAHILAGFDELDRLAKLEVGALDLESGEADFAAIVRKQVSQLQTVLSPRVARFDAKLGEGRAPLALAQSEAEMLCWRLLATIAGAVAAGETVALQLVTEGDQVELATSLPASLREAENIFAVETRPAGGALSAGIFGAGFSLRLARAEARVAGGELVRVGDRLVLSLPLLTAQDAAFSPENASG